MIIGTLSTWEQQRKFQHEHIVQAIQELIKLADRNPDTGRIEVDGDRMYINVMELDAKDPAEQVAEKHEQYIDVHYLLAGDETIGWSPQHSDSKPIKPYDSEDDYMLFAPAADELLIQMKPGMYAVFFPDDIHRPGMGAAGRIKKAVVKVKTSISAASALTPENHYIP